MGTLTKADLRDRIGRRLKLISEGADLTGYQATQIDRAIDDTYSFLEEKGLATWEPNAIPDFLAVPLRDFVAAKNAAYLASPEVQADIEAQERRAYSDIVSLLRSPDMLKVKADTSLTRTSQFRFRR